MAAPTSSTSAADAPELGSFLDEGLWRLLNVEALVVPGLIRTACGILLGAYVVLCALTAANTGRVDHPVLRLVVMGWATLGFVRADRMGWMELRGFTAGLGLLLPLTTAYFSACDGYRLDTTTFIVLAHVAGLGFVATLRDLLAVGVVVIAVQGLLLASFPPATAPAAVIWGLIICGVGVGAAVGVLIIGARAVIDRSARWWRDAHAREHALRAFAEGALSTLSLPALTAVLAQRIEATLPGSRCWFGLAEASATVPTWRGASPHLSQPAWAAKAWAQLNDLAEPILADAQTIVLPLRAFMPGVVVLQGTEPLSLDDRRMPMWRSMAAQAGIAVTNAYAWEQIQAQAERAHQLVEERAQIAELQSRFVTQASHEFRTPLAVIQASANTLGRYADRMTDAQRADRLRKIDQQVQAMTDLLDEILAFGRAEAQQGRHRAATTDVRQLCIDLAADVRAASSVEPELVLQFDGDEWGGVLDAAVLRRALGNLLGNAVKYSPDGGRIDFRCRREGDCFIFEVADQGIGISPEDQAKLFEPFQRGGNVGSIGGAGLGLASTQQALETLGGTIRVESTLGVGTVVVVTLPARPQGAAADDARAACEG